MPKSIVPVQIGAIQPQAKNEYIYFPPETWLYWAIKPKPKTDPPLRRTLKQIVELSTKGENYEAMRLSEWGQSLGFSGVFLEKYYRSLDEWEAAMNGRKIYEPIWAGETSGITHEETQAIYQKLKKEEETICRLFINAVNAHDRKKIIEIADAVWALRKTRHKNFQPFDAQRSRLLLLKTLAEGGGFKPTIRQVAQFLAVRLTKMGEAVKVPIKEDGFSALRRKCKELGVPLAKDRIGRPKKRV